MSDKPTSILKRPYAILTSKMESRTELQEVRRPRLGAQWPKEFPNDRHVRVKKAPSELRLQGGSQWLLSLGTG